MYGLLGILVFVQVFPPTPMGFYFLFCMSFPAMPERHSQPSTRNCTGSITKTFTILPPAAEEPD